MEFKCGRVLGKVKRFQFKEIDRVGGEWKYKGKNIVTERNYLSEGNFGVVSKVIMKIDGEILSIVEKEGKGGAVLDELNVYDRIQRINEFECDIIPVRKTSDNTIIMPSADGSFQDLRGRLTVPQIKQSLKIIGKILKCIYSSGENHFDLKDENILYVCNGDNVEIFVGDMGSIVEIKQVQTQNGDTVRSLISNVMPRRFFSVFEMADWALEEMKDDSVYSFYLSLIGLQLLDYKIPLIGNEKMVLDYYYKNPGFRFLTTQTMSEWRQDVRRGYMAEIERYRRGKLAQIEKSGGGWFWSTGSNRERLLRELDEEINQNITQKENELKNFYWWWDDKQIIPFMDAEIEKMKVKYNFLYSLNEEITIDEYLKKF
jgi:hypothetical protein